MMHCGLRQISTMVFRAVMQDMHSRMAPISRRVSDCSILKYMLRVKNLDTHMAMQRSREHTESGYESMPDLASASSSDTGTTAGSADSVAPTKIKKYTKSSPLQKPHHNVGLWRQILGQWYEHIRDYLLRCGSGPDDLEKDSETDLKDLLREVGEITTTMRVRYGKRFKISVASVI